MGVKKKLNGVILIGSLVDCPHTDLSAPGHRSRGQVKSSTVRADVSRKRTRSLSPPTRAPRDPRRPRWIRQEGLGGRAERPAAFTLRQL